MVLVILCLVCITGIFLFYLQRKLVFAALWNEVQQLEAKKKKLVDEIGKIRLKTAEYSSIPRIHQLFSEEVLSSEFPEQKITTLQIPLDPSRGFPKKETNRIIEHEYPSEKK